MLLTVKVRLGLLDMSCSVSVVDNLTSKISVKWLIVVT